MYIDRALVVATEALPPVDDAFVAAKDRAKILKRLEKTIRRARSSQLLRQNRCYILQSISIDPFPTPDNIDRQLDGVANMEPVSQ